MKTIYLNMSHCVSNFVWNLFIILTVTTTMFACSTKNDYQEPQQQEKAPETFYIAIDMSDRIMHEEEVIKDSIVIQTVFNRFEQKVKDARYIKSNDKFFVNIVPQSSMKEDKTLIEVIKTMQIDLASIEMAKKHDVFVKFKNQLPQTISKLYRLAYKPSKKQYSGSNIWKFMNEQMPSVLSVNKNVNFILLTDGYIEIDNAKEQYFHNGKSNNMNKSIIASYRIHDKWQTDPCNILLLPERLCSLDLDHLNITIAGITPRTDYIYETAMLEKIWVSFINRMNVKKHSFVSYQIDLNLLPSIVRKAILNHP